jgi:lysophospholipase L1-like esterase
MKRMGQNTLLVVCGCMVAFGIAELSVRIILPTPQQIRVVRTETLDDTEKKRSSDAIRHNSGLYSNTRDARISAQTGRLVLELIGKKADRDWLHFTTPTGRRLRPNTHVIIQNHYLSKRRIEIRTNSLGYRNPEIGKKQKTRILFLGDSITFGSYLQEEETFVRLVETISAHRGQNWETINASVKSISLANELAILRETGVSTDPDIVVINFYLNDFAESPAVYAPELSAVLRSSRLLHYICEHACINWRRFHIGRGAFCPEGRQMTRTWREEFEQSYPISKGDYRTSESAFNKLISDSFIDWGGAWSEHAWHVIETTLGEFKEISADHDFKLAIVAFPVCYQVKADYLYDYPQQQLELIAERLDIPILDLLPILREKYRESDDKLFYDYCHPTAYGSRIIAEEVFEYLSGLLRDWI